ncbi:hypothetical protein [Halodesulfovibrio sp. MK-HDV]|jgi:hypothetical protein|uniref:hypothetical protein n=1 Tax=Halodesulfovibrio sp. MK-HDV TaxID=2599925 RepID=UPI0013FA685D|nr:hypothetical protein [Halodesulfovibrio sp. MK-HDV]KAF1073668.1 hypothetical protein MKHDV_03403 [Halodesulfovibrio sp. MK-HDV]
MQWIILVHKSWRHSLYACLFIACSFIVTGCANFQTASSQSGATPPPQIVVAKPSPPKLAAGEVMMRVDLAEIPQKNSIRKTNSQTMKVGQRETVVAGGDILRVLQYNEEVLILPKMSPNKDFTIRLSNPVISTAAEIDTTIAGYSNVTYELLTSSLTGDVLLLDTVFAVPDKSGRLSKDFFMPTSKPNVYKKLVATVKPADVTFKHITRSKVIPSSETHYVIRFVKKEGMAVHFEVRTLKGGSRPRVINRKPISVPLGTPIITIKGHEFKVHTITPDFIDVERLS